MSTVANARHWNTSMSAPDLPEDMATTYSYPLDPFQRVAVAAIHREENVLVCAKTGSGKTLVGEYQIEYSLRKHGRIFYTTPIKSLSNQKFHDLKHSLRGRATVGIMTGDIKFCPDADVIVMTTEILRNLLYKMGTTTEHLGLTAGLSIQGLDAVIFDECHYINDKDRGKVWEETMILLPTTVKMIMLSATLDGPAVFADWLTVLKGRPTQLIETAYRIVPLTHNVCAGTEGTLTLHKIMGPDAAGRETYNDKVYMDWLQTQKEGADAAADFKQRAKDLKGSKARSTGNAIDGPVSGKVRVASFKHRMNRLIGHLHSNGACPALFFCLSRAKCEQYAGATEHTLLDSSDAAAVRHIIDFHLHRYTDLQRLPQYYTIRDLLMRGIAFHHSGVLPLLKEIIEILFTKGYVRLLFATETFAVGLNMPTKTVVFLGLKKYDDSSDSFRVLRTDEYIQMAGRAGRRGKDVEGTVIYFPDGEPVSAPEMRFMMCGGKARIQSRMDFGYDFILKTLHSGQHNWLRIIQDSYWYKQSAAAQETVTQELAAVRQRLQTAQQQITQEQLELCRQRQELEDRLALPLVAKQRKEAERRLAAFNTDNDSRSMQHVWASYKRVGEMARDIERLEGELAAIQNAAIDTVEPRIRYLEQIRYLENVPQDITQITAANLTLCGTLATEVNEGHLLLMTELFLGGMEPATITPDELCSILSCFLEEPRIDHTVKCSGSEVVCKAYSWLQGKAATLRTAEKGLSSEDFWKVTAYWMEPVHRWLSGDELAAVCRDFEIQEGNFIRSLHKLSNLVDEWEGLATYCQNIEWLSKLDGLRTKIIRDIAITNSLYLIL